MKKAMRIYMRGGERIYINGAVLRVDRKVTLELLNDVMFLLENQVMQAADASTPMRQLYFVVQLMLMSPNDTRDAMALYQQLRQAIMGATETIEILQGLLAVDELVGASRYFEALKRLRGLFAVEQDILDGAKALPPVAPVEAA
jgi:flagellar protein FlbT